MKKNEALIIDSGKAFEYGHNLEVVPRGSFIARINKIYDDIENETCDNCQLSDGEYCIEFSIFVPSTHGCKRWKKDV